MKRPIERYFIPVEYMNEFIYIISEVSFFWNCDIGKLNFTFKDDNQ